MGRLLAALIEETGTARPAKPANLANLRLRKPDKFADSQDSQEGVTEIARDGDAARILAALRSEGLPTALIGQVEPAETVGLSARALRAYLVALHETAQRELGNRPLEETAAGLCRYCGPVWLAPEVARAAPTVNGWPLVLGCPWCHVRARQRMPRPSVACSECRHYVADHINPEQGAGRCAEGQAQPRPWPRVIRFCAAWRPAGTTSERKEE